MTKRWGQAVCSRAWTAVSYETSQHGCRPLKVAVAQLPAIGARRQSGEVEQRSPDAEPGEVERVLGNTPGHGDRWDPLKLWAGFSTARPASWQLSTTMLLRCVPPSSSHSPASGAMGTSPVTSLRRGSPETRGRGSAPLPLGAASRAGEPPRRCNPRPPPPSRRWRTQARDAPAEPPSWTWRNVASPPSRSRSTSSTGRTGRLTIKTDSIDVSHRVTRDGLLADDHDNVDLVSMAPGRVMPRTAGVERRFEVAIYGDAATDRRRFAARARRAGGGWPVPQCGRPERSGVAVGALAWIDRARCGRRGRRGRRRVAADVA